MGANVDPLGEVLMRVLPDGFWPLLAPAAALPALLLVPPVVELPVVVPFMEEPVVVPVAADPPAAELPPAEPLPLWANTNVLVSARAAANPIVMSLMFSFLFCFSPKDKQLDDLPFPSVLSWQALFTVKAACSEIPYRAAKGRNAMRVPFRSDQV